MPDLRWTRVAPRKGRGAGFPPLMLIHGFATTVTQCWISTGWIRRLGDERDLVLVQLPWHDDETLTDTLAAAFPDRGVDEHALPLEDSEEFPLTAQDVLDGLAEVIDTITSSPARPQVDVLGYSLGARLAWDLAGEEPQRVRRLCLGGLPATDRLADLARALGEPTQGPTDEADPAVSEVLRFVDSSTLRREALAHCANRLSHPAFSPGPHNAPPQEALLVSGESDVVADDAVLLTYLPDTARHVVLPRRNHVDSLTSGQFVRAVTSFLTER